MEFVDDDDDDGDNCTDKPLLATASFHESDSLDYKTISVILS